MQGQNVSFSIEFPLRKTKNKPIPSEISLEEKNIEKKETIWVVLEVSTDKGKLYILEDSTTQEQEKWRKF